MNISNKIINFNLMTLHPFCLTKLIKLIKLNIYWYFMPFIASKLTTNDQKTSKKSKTSNEILANKMYQSRLSP